MSNNDIGQGFANLFLKDQTVNILGFSDQEAKSKPFLAHRPLGKNKKQKTRKTAGPEIWPEGCSLPILDICFLNILTIDDRHSFYIKIQRQFINYFINPEKFRSFMCCFSEQENILSKMF